MLSRGGVVRVHLRSGQATSEWMVLVSAIVVAAVAVGWLVADGFEQEMSDLGGSASTVYTSGSLGQ